MKEQELQELQELRELRDGFLLSLDTRAESSIPEMLEELQVYRENHIDPEIDIIIDYLQNVIREDDYTSYFLFQAMQKERTN